MMYVEALARLLETAYGLSNVRCRSSRELSTTPIVSHQPAAPISLDLPDLLEELHHARS
jgi:hypothetical protein